MTRSLAIRAHCVECCETAREVPLCSIRDCHLWRYRLGSAPGSKTYAKRVRAAWDSRDEQREELESQGLTLVDMLARPSRAKNRGKKPPSAIPSQGARSSEKRA